METAVQNPAGDEVTVMMSCRAEFDNKTAIDSGLGKGLQTSF
jgi:hypothetical protein